jgi:hypothetical protein
VDGEKGFFETGIHNHNPVWSSDGEWIYFARLEPGQTWTYTGFDQPAELLSV